jgi:hypothetical protein
MDGTLNHEENYIFTSKNKALGFCYFITIQKRKYDLFIDKNIIFKFSDDEIELFLKFYDFMDTLRWPGSRKEFNEIILLYRVLTSEKKINKLSRKNKYIYNFIQKMDKSFSYYQLPPIDNISGLLSVHLFRSSKYNKNIYLLGEKHINNIQCPSFIEISPGKQYIYNPRDDNWEFVHSDEGKKIFEDVKESGSVYIRLFVDTILHNKSFFVDFLFETWYKDKLTLERGYLMNGLGALTSFKADKCLEKKSKNMYSKKQHKGKEECFFFRIEPVDYRRINDDSYFKVISKREKILTFFKDEKNTSYVFQYLSQRINYPVFVGLNLKFLEEILEIEHIKKIIDMFIIPKHGRRIIIEYFLNLMLNKNEFINDIKKSYLSNEILSFIKERVLSVVKEKRDYEYEKKYMKIYENLKYPDNILYGLIKPIYEFIVTIETYIMDGFLLSKLFKKMKHDPGEDHGPDEIRNCIIFAGNHHIETYKKFFKYIGSFNKVSSYSYDPSNANSCASIKDFSQPFFNFNKNIS